MLDCSFRSRWPSTWRLRELVDHHLDLGNAPGRANPGDKMLTLVASALAGGDCIDGRRRVAHRGNRPDPGLRSQGAVHPGDVPAQLPVGLRPPIGSGHLPRAAGTGLVGWRPDPVDAPFTIDLDSTICETYGLAKEGARDHGYTGKPGAITRCWPWPLAPATC